MAKFDGAAPGGTSKLKSSAIAVGILLGISAVIVLGVIWFLDRGSRTQSATVPAEVIEATPKSWSSGRSSKSGHRVLYRFQASGQTYERAEEHNSWYKPGSSEPLHVCYDPANPANSNLRSPSGSDCGKGLLF